MLRLAIVPFLAALAGCTGALDAPARGDEPVESLVPIVRMTAGQPDTLLVRDLIGTDAPARFGEHPNARIVPLGAGRIVVETPGDFSGLAQVPFEVEGARYVLVVESTIEGPGAPEGELILKLVGVDAEEPDVLAFSVLRLDATGAEVPSELDEETAIVALLDNRPFEDNAIDAFDDYARLDLDAAGPGRQRLRLAARVDGLVSDWIALDLVDGRPVTER